jgi:hypothetical protein
MPGKGQEVKQLLLWVVALSVRLRASLLNSPMLPINCPIGPPAPSPTNFPHFTRPTGLTHATYFYYKQKDDMSFTETLFRNNTFIKIIFKKMWTG